jgi:hypothetical protein
MFDDGLTAAGLMDRLTASIESMGQGVSHSSMAFAPILCERGFGGSLAVGCRPER